MIIEFGSEPVVRVGLIVGATEARVSLSGRFRTAEGDLLAEGDYTVSISDGKVRLDGETPIESELIKISPLDVDLCQFTVHDVTIGIDFHWQRKESQRFQGSLVLACDAGGRLALINELPLESYLVSVISSEMSASCPPELLRAHAIVSRSWLLAQMNRPDGDTGHDSSTANDSSEEMIRWYGRESHSGFDVCADDHCQRYQGVSKAFSKEAFDAVEDTRGKVIAWGEEICDARYSKSCGGMTEVFSAAWEDKNVPYLKAIYDGPANLLDSSGAPVGFSLPLTEEKNAAQWITSSPEAYCNMASGELLARILPGFDQETRDFYRWTVEYSQEELREILRARLGIDFGSITALEPVERGESGRLIKLRIKGEKKSLVIGKELEIRRALSRSHLYGSAFVVITEKGEQYPRRFKLVGAGWGHGVGLCQIGAAVMADLGFTHEKILSHYFTGVRLKALY